MRVCVCVCECVIGLRRECVVKAREYVCVLVLCRLDESVEWMPGQDLFSLGQGCLCVV